MRALTHKLHQIKHQVHFILERFVGCFLCSCVLVFFFFLSYRERASTQPNPSPGQGLRLRPERGFAARLGTTMKTFADHLNHDNIFGTLSGMMCGVIDCWTTGAHTTKGGGDGDEISWRYFYGRVDFFLHFPPRCYLAPSSPAIARQYKRCENKTEQQTQRKKRNRSTEF